MRRSPTPLPAIALLTTALLAAASTAGGAAPLTAPVPAAPRSPAAVPGNGRAAVTWNPPLGAGGAAITAYVVTPYRSGVAQPSRVFHSTRTKQVIFNLRNGVSYTFRIAARNESGTGPTSRASPAVWPRWAPTKGAPWQLQLTAPVDTTVKVGVYDIDMFDNSSAVVERLHQLRRKVICYVDVGSWENWRPDAAKFPSSLLGNGNGWPGERWIDIRQTSVLAPIFEARFARCKRKGFDAVDPDNVDGYSNDTGFPLTADDQLAFNRWIAKLAHSMGLGVGLKNDVDQTNTLVGSFDFAVNEQCIVYNECKKLTPFTNAGKAVLHVEYNRDPAQFCAVTEPMGFSSMKKHLSLDAWREGC